MNDDNFTIMNMTLVVHTVPNPGDSVYEDLADARDSIRRVAEAHLDLIGRNPDVTMVSSYVSVSGAEMADGEEEWGTLP